MEHSYAEPFKIKMVESIKRYKSSDYSNWIESAGNNLFNLRSNQVYIDLLTDSGTGAMSDVQWSALFTGDESYAGSSSYFNLQKSVEEVTGFPYFLPVHQGRAAENVLFSTLIKEGDIVPGNAHFDTTKAHIEFRKAIAVDCTIDQAYDTSSNFAFKGNIDLLKLEDVLNSYPIDKIPFIIVTVTCNSTGGQPVSMDNLRGVKEIANRYGIPVIFDAARFAENAYFIKTREKFYAEKSIEDIVREMFSYADAMTMSSKKDAIVNIGGFIGFREEELYRMAARYNILFEGYVTYGGMSGRDMNALAIGLKEGIEFEYLQYRIEQVKYLGKRLTDNGIPIQMPVGGHAVFIDADKFLPNVPKEQFRGQTLAVELYAESGVRSCEIGTLMADRDPVTGQNRYPEIDFLRLAIPRRVYTNSHLDYVASSLISLYNRRDEITKGLEIVEESSILRHFTVKLRRIK